MRGESRSRRSRRSRRRRPEAIPAAIAPVLVGALVLVAAPPASPGGPASGASAQAAPAPDPTLPNPPSPPSAPGLPGATGPSGSTGPSSPGSGGGGAAPPGASGGSGAATGPSGPTGPAGPGNPRVRAQYGCYAANRRVTVSGRGFVAGARYRVLLDSKPLGSGTVRANGTMGGALNSGSLFRGAVHQRHTVVVTDGAARASTSFDTSRFTAFFTPSAGDPHTLLVRFSAYAFGPNQPHHPSLYLHYVGPDHRDHRTVGLGRTHGACGSLPRTRQRHLFPFAVSSGTWRLQFDIRSRYSSRNRPRFVRMVRVR
ncbi:MAG: hypothetical protein E6G56_12585 [Actinobacteria bacterium]|nr:MAG: hypothetical protein E6G56_12585 [Actinomycetota bacterium]